MNKEKTSHEPLYRISVAAKLCGVHPQTLRAYEKLGFVSPKREGDKNRLYSDSDVERVKRVQRLTRDLGVNLAGVEVILNLLDQMDEIQSQIEDQFSDYVKEIEKRMEEMRKNPHAPVRRGGDFLPIPRFQFRNKINL